MLEILKLVETRTSRRQQHDVSGARRMRSDLDGAFHRSGPLDRYASLNLLFDFVGSRSDQQRQNGLFAQRL